MPVPSQKKTTNQILNEEITGLIVALQRRVIVDQKFNISQYSVFLQKTKATWGHIN